MRSLEPSRIGAVLLVAALAASCGGADSVTEGAPPGVECPRLIEDALLGVPGPPDGAAACASGVCNYQTQEGCAADEACRPRFNAEEPTVSPGCEPAGAGVAGDACEEQADCAPAHYCVEGACRKQCCGGDWSACNEGESCIRSLQVRAGGEVVSAEMDLCFPVGTCDPLAADGCEPGRECKIVDPTGAVACAPLSNAQLGDPCAPPSVCTQGATCVGGVCVKLCSFQECGPVTCAAEEGTCVRFERDPPGVGECTLGR